MNSIMHPNTIYELIKQSEYPEIAKICTLNTQTHKICTTDSLVIKLIQQKKRDVIMARNAYYQRCYKYIHGYDDKEINTHPIKEISNVIIEAHKLHNEHLLKDEVFEGCCQINAAWNVVDSDSEDCTWTYGHRRCECGNYKGFTWNTDNVDWLNDINLDSTEYVGYQDRLW